MKSSHLLSSVTVALSLALASCSPATDSALSTSNVATGQTQPAADSSDQAIVPATTSVESASGVAGTAELVDSLPFGQYLSDQFSIVEELSAARDRRIASCMKAKGFDFVVSPRTNHRRDPVAMRYGLPDQTSLSTNGYSTSAAQVDEVQAVAASSPGYIEALYGGGGEGDAEEPVDLQDADGRIIGQISMPKGCLGQALIEIFGSSQGYMNFAQTISQLDSLSSSSYQAALSSPQMSGLNEEWNSCMQAAGHADFPTPDSALNADWRINSDQPSDLELAVATTDGRCREDVDYASRALLIEADFQREEIEKYNVLMSEMAEFRRMLSSG